MDSRTSWAAFLRNHRFRRPLSLPWSQWCRDRLGTILILLIKCFNCRSGWVFFVHLKMPNNPYVRLYARTNTGLNLSTSSILMKHWFFLSRSCSMAILDFYQFTKKATKYWPQNYIFNNYNTYRCFTVFD